MTKFQYNGDDELHFPSLGLVVKSGDVFEAPDDVANVSGIVVFDSKKASKDVSEKPVESEEA